MNTNPKVASMIIPTRYFFTLKPLSTVLKVIQNDLETKPGMMIFIFTDAFSDSYIQQVIKKVEKFEDKYESSVTIFTNFDLKVISTLHELANNWAFKARNPNIQN